MHVFPMILVRGGGLPFDVWQSLDSGTILEAPADSAWETAAQALQSAFDAALAEIPVSDFRTALYNARKLFFQKRKMPGDALVAALKNKRDLPVVQNLLDHLHQWAQLEQSGSALGPAYSTRLHAEWKAIQQLAASEHLQRALLFASHGLLDELPGFCAKDPNTFDKKDRKTAFSVYQYASRAIFKTSPLGRFTTVQLWRPGQEQSLEFDREKIAVTPSVAILPALYEVLLQAPAFYQSLEIGLNPCISNDRDGSESLSWLYFDGEQEAFQRMAPNPVADWVVSYLLENNRKIPYQQLLAALAAVVEGQPAQLEALVQGLIAPGLLEWQWPEKGLTPSWCSNLCNYLSFLPSAPLLTDTAFLLQSLRVTARAIPFQSLEAARESQQGAKRQIEAFFQQYHPAVPSIPVEQIFFEDVENTLPIACAETAISDFATDLTACWHNSGEQPLPPFRARLHHFASETLQPGQVLDFQVFCQLFLAAPTVETTVYAPLRPGKIGALLQVYQDSGAPQAVVNALFPGGGKLFARWSHLFTTALPEALAVWNGPEMVPFPWQGWSNANFQSFGSRQALSVPDGRVGKATPDNTLLLSDLGVRLGAYGPELVDKKSLKTVLLTDLGLEAPESRPPAIQVLWHLGVPYVSSVVLPREPWKMAENGLKTRKRTTFKSLVLARAAWEWPLESLKRKLKTSHQPWQRFWTLKKSLRDAGVPRFFFARLQEQRQKPQFFDYNSPVSMLLLEKMLTAGSEGYLLIEEMLPTPDQWVLGASGNYVGEFVVELLP